MSRSEWDYPEHFKAGLTPHGPQDKYYFARGPQLVNRVVDTSDYIDAKVRSNLANLTQGPAGDQGPASGAGSRRKDVGFRSSATTTTPRTAPTPSTSPCVGIASAGWRTVWTTPSFFTTARTSPMKRSTCGHAVPF